MDKSWLIRHSFDCDCMTPAHRMVIDYNAEDNILVFSLIVEPKGIKDRIIQAFHILKGDEWWDHDIVIDPNDYDRLDKTIAQISAKSKEFGDK